MSEETSLIYMRDAFFEMIDEQAEAKGIFKKKQESE